MYIKENLTTFTVNIDHNFSFENFAASLKTNKYLVQSILE